MQEGSGILMITSGCGPTYHLYKKKTVKKKKKCLRPVSKLQRGVTKLRGGCEIKLSSLFLTFLKKSKTFFDTIDSWLPYAGANQ